MQDALLLPVTNKGLKDSNTSPVGLPPHPCPTEQLLKQTAQHGPLQLYAPSGASGSAPWLQALPEQAALLAAGRVRVRQTWDLLSWSLHLGCPGRQPQLQSG